MRSSDTLKYWILLVAAVVLLAFAAVYWSLNYYQPPGPQTSRPGQTAITNIPNRELPKNIPADLPGFGAEKSVIQNYENFSPEHGLQSTRRYTLDKTPAQLYDEYQRYLISSSWSLNTTYQQANLFVISAQKDGRRMQVTMSVQGDSVNSATVVSVDVVSPN